MEKKKKKKAFSVILLQLIFQKNIISKNVKNNTFKPLLRKN